MVKVVDYQLVAMSLYKLGADRILRIYVMEHEQLMILVESHTRVVGGYYVGWATTKYFTCWSMVAHYTYRC